MSLVLISQAAHLRNALVKQQRRIVFVESCTGGWLAASMAALPGISQSWCGSLVVYRSDSKHRWLGIENNLLQDPLIGPVSEPVTRQLASEALTQTPEADVAVAVTGDLGPGVGADKDGLVFFAIAWREHSEVSVRYTRLSRPAPADANDIEARVARLEEASLWVLEQTLECVQNTTAFRT